MWKLAGILAALLTVTAPAMALDEAKCIIGATSLVPRSPVTAIAGARVRALSPAETKRYPMAAAWIDVDVTALDRKATYTFMCGTNSDGGTAVSLMK